MYSKKEVVKMLVNNMNNVMKMIDTSKYYIIDFDTERVFCIKKHFIKKDSILSTYSFDYTIREAGGAV